MAEGKPLSSQKIGRWGPTSLDDVKVMAPSSWRRHSGVDRQETYSAFKKMYIDVKRTEKEILQEKEGRGSLLFPAWKTTLLFLFLIQTLFSRAVLGS